jgi:DNA-binding NarL/FixJ family response regulator
MIGRFLRSEEGIIAGGIVLLTRAPLHQRASEVAAPLARVGQAAETALRGALAMAAALGARFPRISLATLSGREREVAALAAGGFSDVNIGARLGISEGTVGRHLHSIYRKLGIGSRMALSDLLGGAAAFDPPERTEAA